MELSTDAADIYRAFSRSLLSTAFRKLLGWLPLESTPESATLAKLQINWSCSILVIYTWFGSSSICKMEETRLCSFAICISAKAVKFYSSKKYVFIVTSWYHNGSFSFKKSSFPLSLLNLLFCTILLYLLKWRTQTQLSLTWFDSNLRMAW